MSYLFSNSVKYDTSTTGGGVATPVLDDSTISLIIYGTSGDQIIRQSYRNFVLGRDYLIAY